jgi:hypothetical protein
MLVVAVALPLISESLPTWVGGASAVLPSAAALRVATQTITVLDPVGDANYNAPAFLDAVLVQMTKTPGGDFELLMAMAGPVPAAPPMPPPAQTQLTWVWHFDLDPTTFPQGYPYHQAEGPAEFSVRVRWDGTAFTGEGVDRRPLLTGGEAVITPVIFSISGTIVQADLPYTLIGDVPASFRWFAGTGCQSGPIGSSESHKLIDVAVFTP